MLNHHLKVNGQTIHAVEAGEGPAVLFLHGFPDTWRSWRRQIEAVAAAGYRAVAIDLRGFGESSVPAAIEAYTPLHIIGDCVAVLDSLEISNAALVGHDFGATTAWYAALVRPDRFRAVFGVSVPYDPPSLPNFLDQLSDAGHNQFYMFEQMDPESDNL
ncbi:alpha/beta fold hydrolase [Qipengyuania flava]|uniref:alpha/beta fold hydrolase n=1 Tax=Qipengyuania flava TaxID=192812 RepID=UPI001CD3F7D8|nr:alpha/beta hydrolase [Qipengyuania flava]MCA0891785.1 alpha/beta hydrolase [Qipengyuania flava]